MLGTVLFLKRVSDGDVELIYQLSFSRCCHQPNRLFCCEHRSDDVGWKTLRIDELPDVWPSDVRVYSVWQNQEKSIYNGLPESARKNGYGHSSQFLTNRMTR